MSHAVQVLKDKLKNLEYQEESLHEQKIYVENQLLHLTEELKINQQAQDEICEVIESLEEKNK